MTYRATYHRARPSVADHGPHVPVRVVLHSTESDGLGPGYADGVCGYWQRQGLGYGAHFIVSREGTVSTCLGRSRIAWHVENHNTGSIGIEQAGFARFSAMEWISREKELDAVARVIARLAAAFTIPLEHSTDRGVSMHIDCSREFGGSHTDPGHFYPFSHVLGMARSYAHAGGWNGTWNASGK